MSHAPDYLSMSAFAAPMTPRPAQHILAASNDNAMSSAERSALGQQILACWLPPQGAVPVTVAFSLDRSGRPVAGSVTLRGTGQGMAKASYHAAKRAVLRCGRGGFDLPVEKYAKWRNIELTFDPERTNLR
ncbi:hypothetical protein ABMC88_00330 [Sulfitobacter sp. HNIBRBA2951]|uniref:hypothetical protein n=1 Tax=Sulfitobacter aquimarinus TaxID=3158557 RepID=UPI0032E055CB